MDGKSTRILGLTVGVVLMIWTMMSAVAYNCDITYITNNELGFDYLRDMVIYKEQLVKRAELCGYR